MAEIHHIYSVIPINYTIAEIELGFALGLSIIQMQRFSMKNSLISLILGVSSFLSGWCFKEDLIPFFFKDFPKVRIFI